MITDKTITESLNHAPDYSESFTRFVRDIGEGLAAKLHCFPMHDANMDYAAGQRLAWLFSNSGDVVDDRSTHAQSRLDLFVSSRGKVFTCKVRSLVNTKGMDEQDGRPR